MAPLLIEELALVRTRQRALAPLIQARAARGHADPWNRQALAVLATREAELAQLPLFPHDGAAAADAPRRSP